MEEEPGSICLTAGVGMDCLKRYEKTLRFWRSEPGNVAGVFAFIGQAPVRVAGPVGAGGFVAFRSANAHFVRAVHSPFHLRP